MEEKKVTEEELQAIKDLQNNYFKVTFDIGNLAIDKKTKEAELEDIKATELKAFQALESLRSQEKQLSDTLNEKYGSSTVDLETGVIK